MLLGARRVIGADIRRYSQDRGGAGLNFVLGVIHGALLTLADTLLYPTIVLSLFVAQLTNDLTRIALVPVIATTVWLIPQIVTAPLMAKTRRQLPWATGAAIIQSSAILLLAYVGYRSDLNNDDRLRSFFICYIAYNVASGFARVPSRVLIVRAISADHRGQFLALRSLWGAVLALGAGVVARKVLGPTGSDFPRNFAQLFVVAAAAVTAAAFFQMRMREPARLANVVGVDRGFTMRAMPQIVGDVNFRRFAAFRILLTASTFADPFFILYAQRELNVPVWYVGIYLLAFTGARLLTSPLWAWAERRGGHRTILQTTALVRLVAPLVALILPYLVDSQLYQDRFDDNRPIFYTFALVFAAFGASAAGLSRANYGYLHAIAPATERTAYGTAANIVVAIAALAPLAGARVLDRYSYDTLFVSAAIVGLVAIFFSGVLTDTHTRTRPVAHAWRLRGQPR